MFVKIKGITIPVKRWIKIDINGLNEKTIFKIIKKSKGIITINMHSFSFIKGDKKFEKAIGINYKKIKEFIKLLERLKDEKYSTILMRDIQLNKKVNCFVVGNPRSGTTALHNILSQHPDIYIPDPVAPYHFCTDIHKESDKFHGKMKYFTKYRSIVEFEQLYNGRRESILCDISTNYLISKKAAENIYKYNPKAKIIIMLREPIDFLRSLHQELVFQGVERYASFEKALTAEKKRRKGEDIPKKISTPQDLFYFKRADFVRKIRRYYKFFDKKQIKIILYDDFKNDYDKTIKDILEFLGVDSQIKLKNKVVNQSKVVNMPNLNRLISILSTMTIKNVVPTKIRRNVGKMIKKRISSKKREEIPKETKEKLMKYFKPQVKELSKITNIDLCEKWGYKDE